MPAMSICLRASSTTSTEDRKTTQLTRMLHYLNISSNLHPLFFLPILSNITPEMNPFANINKPKQQYNQ